MLSAVRVPRSVAGRLVTLVAVGVLAGCGGESDDPTMKGASDQASCAPASDHLVISADDLEFDKSCLVAPAGQPFSIVFANKENLPHNVDILRADDSSEKLFRGEIFSGTRTVTYRVPALPAGTYEFNCAVHPSQMKGTLRVE